MAATQRVRTVAGSTWTVVGSDLRVVEPVEQYLEFARASEFSPNTVKAYARGLALWWTFLERSGRPWTDVGLAEFGRFIQDLRHGQIEAPVRELHPAEVLSDATVALRVRAVMSFYRYQAACGGPSVAHLYDKIRTSPGSYLPFMEHIARRDGRVRSKIRVRVARTEAPVLSPAQVDALITGEATWDAGSQDWDGDLRYRLLWSLMAETGLRLGEPCPYSTATGRPGAARARRSASCAASTRTAWPPRAGTAASTSARASSSSTPITCGGSATAAPTRSSTTGTAPTCSATPSASRAMHRCGPRASTTTSACASAGPRRSRQG